MRKLITLGVRLAALAATLTLAACGPEYFQPRPGHPQPPAAPVPPPPGG